MMRLLIVIALMAFLATPAEAQRRCKKGIPCGNSCISANKVCHIGAPAPPPPSPLPRDTPESLAQRGLLSVTAPATRSGIWVASVDGTTYYRATCATAAKLTEDERVYFDSELQARAVGYKRSKARNC
jgi:hypothetical protein